MARILVIDDEDGVRAIVREMLERAGYEVLDAPEGGKGLELLRERPVDLVITDLFMPEKEGIATIRELRRNFPNVKIIAMSGGGRTRNLDILSDAKRLGAARTLTKPFDPQEMLAAVEEVLAS